MSFSFLQRGIPQEGKILVGGGGWRWAMSFSLRQRGNPHKAKSSWERGGRWSHQREYLKTIFYWSFHEVFFFINEETLTFLPPSTRKFSSWGFPLWRRENFMATFKDSHEFFSSSKKKFSWEKNPLGRVGGRGWKAMSFSLRQRGNPHEEKILVGEGREVESPERISQNEILLKFPWGFFSLSMRKPSHYFPLP